MKKTLGETSTDFHELWDKIRPIQVGIYQHMRETLPDTQRRGFMKDVLSVVYAPLQDSRLQIDNVNLGKRESCQKLYTSFLSAAEHHKPRMRLSEEEFDTLKAFNRINCANCTKSSDCGVNPN